MTEAMHRRLEADHGLSAGQAARLVRCIHFTFRYIQHSFSTVSSRERREGRERELVGTSESHGEGCRESLLSGTSKVPPWAMGRLVYMQHPPLGTWATLCYAVHILPGD